MKQPLLLPIIHGGAECYQVYEDWKFVVDGGEITVPMGFVCDGASIPRVLWCLKPPDGTHRAAALAHDWLYANKGEAWPDYLSRRQCDGIFRSLLTLANIGGFIVRLMYRGVRIGGWVPWGKPKNVVILPVRNAVTASQGHRNHLYSAPQ